MINRWYFGEQMIEWISQTYVEACNCSILTLKHVSSDLKIGCFNFCSTLYLDYTYLYPASFVRVIGSLFIIVLKYISKLGVAEVIIHLPLPVFQTFSFIGSFTDFLSLFCKAIKWLPIGSDPRHVSSAVSSEKPLLLTQREGITTNTDHPASF